MHAFFQLQALFLSDIIFVSYPSFYLESLHHTHICLQLSPIHCALQLAIYVWLKNRLYDLKNVHISG